MMGWWTVWGGQSMVENMEWIEWQHQFSLSNEGPGSWTKLIYCKQHWGSNTAIRFNSFIFHLNSGNQLYDFEFNLEFIHSSVFFKKLTCTGLCKMNFNISFAHWQFFHLQTSRHRPASHKQIVALDWFLYTSVVC